MNHKMFLSSTKKQAKQQYNILVIILKRKNEEKQTYSPRLVGCYHIHREREERKGCQEDELEKEKKEEKNVCSFFFRLTSIVSSLSFKIIK